MGIPASNTNKTSVLHLMIYCQLLVRCCLFVSFGFWILQQTTLYIWYVNIQWSDDITLPLASDIRKCCHCCHCYINVQYQHHSRLLLLLLVVVLVVVVHYFKRFNKKLEHLLCFISSDIHPICILCHFWGKKHTSHFNMPPPKKKKMVFK